MPELPLTMPKMSMTMEEGTMVSWLKQVGDPVRAGEPICEVATDKVDMEVESPFDGTVARIVAQPDEIIAVGETIAYITTDADDLLGGLFDEPAPESGIAAESQQPPAPDASTAPAEPIEGDWVPSVPRARAIADERGVQLASVGRTGPGGVVRVVDVEAASSAAQQAPAAPAAPVAPPAPAAPPAPVPSPAVSASAVPPPAPDAAEARRRRTRQQVARVMNASASVPQFTAFRTLDLSVAAAVRATLLGGASWTAILVRAHALALSRNPALTATWSDSGVIAEDHIGIALAIDSPTGLIAPVLVDPHRIPISDLAAEIGQVVADARSGSLALERLSGGTSVLSNLGGFGVEWFNALLTPPQATALSTGSVAKRMVVYADGSFAPRLTCTVGLTVDHRLADGADAARCIADLAAIMAEPAQLIDVSSE